MLSRIPLAPGPGGGASLSGSGPAGASHTGPSRPGPAPAAPARTGRSRIGSAGTGSSAGASGTTVVFSGGGTGGHLYPALALADALARIRPGLRAVFVGAERGIEARVLPQRGLEHLLLPVEGFRRGELLANLAVLRALLRALVRVAALFRRLRPSLVVVTGGYAGGPAGLMAALLGIRLVLQEQNAEPGVTTRVLSRWATETHLAFPEAARRLPRAGRSGVQVTGNPVRPPESIDRREAAEHFGLDPDRPVILAVGGSQGALPLNRALLELAEGVAAGALAPLHPAQLLWATGPTHLDEVTRALDALGHPAWIRVVGYIERMPLALGLADLAVSRAGAMATSEFLAWGLPALLVPLPGAAADHQTLNARALEEAGAAQCLLQADLDGTRLHAELQGLLVDQPLRAAMTHAARSRGRPDAAHQMALRLDALLPPPVRREGAGSGGAA